MFQSSAAIPPGQSLVVDQSTLLRIARGDGRILLNILLVVVGLDVDSRVGF